MIEIENATFTYDATKNEDNFAKHGLRLSDFSGFDELVLAVPTIGAITANFDTACLDGLRERRMWWPSPNAGRRCG